MIVMGIVAGIGIDEDEIKGPAELRQDLQRRACTYIDLVPMRVAAGPFPSERREAGIDLAVDQVAVIRQAFRHCERAGSIEGADLQNVLRTHLLDHHLQKGNLLQGYFSSTPVRTRSSSVA